MLRKVLLAGLLCMLPLSAMAQSNAVLMGVVTDESKGVLPGVTVTATDAASGRQYVATTDERGEYRMPAVLPGTYKVQADLSGFATILVPSVELLVGQQANLPFSMKVATLAETITVTGEAPLINTETAVVGGNIDRRQMQDLPILGRNWTELSLLVKGVTANSATTNRAGAARDDQFQLNVDGQQITQGISTSDTFGQPRVSREAIAEYALSTSGFDVTQGRSIGMTVQAITRSGTNNLQGAVFGSFRDDKWNAADAVATNPDGTLRVLPFANQQTGFSLGGPIIQNKLHYFGAYEFEREPNTTLVIPAAWQNANVAVKTLTFPTKRTENNTSVRADYQISNQDRLALRGHYWTYDIPFGALGGNSYPTAASATTRKNRSLIGTWTRVISNTLVQEVKAGYTRYDWATVLGEGVPATPFYTLTGLPSIGGTSFYPETFWQKTPSFRYDLTWNKSAHNFKFGAEFLPRRDGADWPNNTRGQFAIQSGTETASTWAARFPLEAWNDPSKWNLAGLRATRFNVSFANNYVLDLPRDTYAFWAGDTWSVNDKLTLNYGVRYDLDWGGLAVPGGIDTPVIINNGQDVNLDAGTHTGIRDLSNLAPRAGVNVKVTDSLVVRGGAGMFYNFQTSNLLTGFQQQLTNERRFATIDILNSTNRADFITNPLGSVTVADYLAGRVPIPPVALRNLDPEYRNPNSLQVTGGFQKQLGQVFGFDADLIYLKGMNLGYDREVNLPQDPATGFPRNIDFPTAGSVARPNPSYQSIRFFQSTLESEDLRLATSFTRRLRDRWQAGGTYTHVFYSRDHGTNGFGYLAAGNNPFCQECEWGTSSAYQQHTVRLNGIYQAPLGFMLSGIFSFGSGTRNATSALNQAGAQPIALAGGFFGVNRFVTGPFTVTDNVTYPDKSVHSNYERLVDGTPTSYTAGQQVPRNAFQGLPIHKLDIRASKRFTVPGTSLRLEGTIDVINLYNHANYSAYNTQMNLPSFGIPTAAYENRQIQLGFRADF